MGIIIVVLVLLVIAGAGAGFYFYEQSSDASASSTSTTVTATETGSGATVTDQSTDTVTDNTGTTVTAAGATTAHATTAGGATATKASTSSSKTTGSAGATGTTKADTTGSATAEFVSVTAAASASVTASAGYRKMTVANGCDYTIWPAIFTGGGEVPDVATGWEAAAGSSVSFLVKEGWDGRIWGRMGCDFSANSTLPSTCLTGGCNGGLECALVGGTGVPPASLVEFNIANSSSYPLDNYDMSLVDGFNLPIEVTNDAGCPVSSCHVDLNTDCPTAAMTVYSDSSNTTAIGCYTDCGAYGLDQYCCAGANNLPSTCPSSGIPHFAYFHNNCPAAYAYAYDDSDALYTCDLDLAANFVLTFCPSDMSAPQPYTSGEVASGVSTAAAAASASASA